jgi:hypothetical protein
LYLHNSYASGITGRTMNIYKLISSLELENRPNRIS